MRVWAGVSLAVLACALAPAAAAADGLAVRQISTADPFTNPTSQHRTAVEPDSFAWGDTIVAAFQVGRFFDGGAAGIGFATSRDGGRSWTSGFLPALTVYSTPAGPWSRATDPSVAYDAVHGVWLVSTLALNEPCSPCADSAVLVSRSTDGVTWSGPVVVSPPVGAFTQDKNWTSCDNWPSSPYAGRCYTAWSETTTGFTIRVSSSVDGGASWSASRSGGTRGSGVQPLARPDGRLVIPYLTTDGVMASIDSVDGGRTFGSVRTIKVVYGAASTPLRTPAMPSAEIDGAGRIYLAWHDCSLRAGCGTPKTTVNDILIATTSDGTTWSAPARVPLDPPDSTVDHLIPGLGVDRTTSGESARLALAYYFVPNAPCDAETCQLHVGMAESADGGRTWSQPLHLTPPMKITSLPDTLGGRMVGDYISTSFVGGTPVPVFSYAAPADTAFHQAIFARTPLPSPAPPAPPAPTPAPAPAPAAPQPPAEQPPAAPPAATVPPAGAVAPAEAVAPPTASAVPTARWSVSRLALSPARPRPGDRFVVRVRVTGGRPDAVRCHATLAGRPVAVRIRIFHAAFATCGWRVPRRTTGNRLRGALTVVLDGAPTVRAFALRIR